MTLGSFPAALDAVVVGATGGIGGALVDALLAEGARVWALSRTPGAPRGPHEICAAIDIEDEASIAEAARLIAGQGAPRLVIVASGVLHAGGASPEKSARALDPAVLARTFAINAIGPALVAKHMLPLMPREGRTVLAALSARVGSIGDNRAGGWYGYRASKAALNQMIRTLAIERGRVAPDAVLLALHPGTVATDLSRPVIGAGEGREVFTPQVSAGHLLRVIDGAHETGAYLAWDGTTIAY